jgi:hypothetical protein
MALNTPRSWARSLICSTTVFRTPSPATTMSRMVSTTARKTTALSAGLLVLVLTSKEGPSLTDRAFAYDCAVVPGPIPTSYWSGGRPGTAAASVAALMNASAEVPCGSKTSPTMRTVVVPPAEVSAYVSPTAVPVSVRNAVLTSAWPLPVYQRPVIRLQPIHRGAPA